MHELGKFHGFSIAMKYQRPEEFAELEQMRDLSRPLFKSEMVIGIFRATLDRAISSLKIEEHKNILRSIVSW